MGGLSFSWEIVTTEVKGWITKKFSSKGGRLPREQMHHPLFPWIALWL
jgi:hypothetical protein